MGKATEGHIGRHQPGQR